MPSHHKPEAAFQRSVIELAEACGWQVFAPPADMRRCHGAGYPDLTLLRGDRLVFAELKAPKGRVSDAQRGWHAGLRRVPGIECRVWRPGDLDDIEETLARRRRAA